MTHRTLLAAALALGLAGCSLIIDTGNDENRPCQDGACLAGFMCQDGICVKAPAAGPDAGTPDAGATPFVPPGRSGLTSVGPRVSATGNPRLTREGLQTFGRSCAGTTCVTGGIVP